MVGDLNRSVSEIIAAQRIPAISLEGLIPDSSYISLIIVAVDPTGSALKNTGEVVRIFATL